jgi:ferrous iron transport protein A
MDAEQLLEPGAPAGHAWLLSEATVGTRVRIETLPSDSALKDRLLALGIRPGVQVEVLRRGRPGGILHLAHGLLEFMLRQEQARQMTVTPCPGNLRPQGRP